jgi:hypothetical protein
LLELVFFLKDLVESFQRVAVHSREATDSSIRSIPRPLLFVPEPLTPGFNPVKLRALPGSEPPLRPPSACRAAVF